MDAAGNIYVADTLNHVIRKLSMDGTVTTIAGIPGQYGFADGAVEEALFYNPMGIAVSDDGIIFIADTGNHLIRVIEDGQVRTLAGKLLFTDIDDCTYCSRYAIDYLEDVDKIEQEDEDCAGCVCVPLGGFADGYEALFNLPMGLALWRGKLIVADSANHCIRAILDSGEVITIAGTGYTDYVGGLPNEAAFHFPKGVYVLNDRLFIVDTGNNVIRMMDLISLN
jgi:DNA-binding beta-propeller fold protein YncE